MKQIVYKSSARKALRRIPKNTAKLILGKIEQYAEDPASLANNVKKLQGREGIRLRVGDWRVIMHDGIVLEVIKFGSRGDVYND